MNEINPKDKLSFILYKNKKVPSFFEIDKGFLNFFYYGLPLITLIALFGAGSLLVYFKQIREVAKRKEPAIIKELKIKNMALKETIIEAQVTSKTLERKLISGASGTGLLTMSFFKASPGQEDMTKSPDLAIESISSSQDQKSYALKFNLSNNSSNQEKIAGYIFVMMKSNNSYHFYPGDIFEDNEMQINFNKGEYFATSRFRPVEAKFPLPPKATVALFKILVFSRTGDLLLKQIISKKIEL